MINQNSEMIQDITNNLEVAEMMAGSNDPNDQRVIKECIEDALASLYHMASVAAIPGSGVIQ